MSDSKELGLLGDLGSHQTPGCRSSAGCLGRGPLVLLFLAFMLLAVLLVTIVIQVSKLPSSLGQEQSRQEAIYQELTRLKAGPCEFPERSRQEKIHQELTQLKDAVDHLCRPCPWDWTFFQGNCYFFSNSQRSWHDSITACQEVGAQLVVIKGEEEQNFLQLQSSGRNRFSWIGMSDLTHEGTWQWVDGSPLPPRGFAASPSIGTAGSPTTSGRKTVWKYSARAGTTTDAILPNSGSAKSLPPLAPGRKGGFLPQPLLPQPSLLKSRMFPTCKAGFLLPYPGP
ncbi:CD209 antigen-like protein 2 isoform X2 [Lemur catta]|uniref:CD209 antigen-like protein 2 isoform X2 n=1 Tax=Lemur catta TaxID=9447 RepID=UPI001E26D4BF|nr:CD209 antigen-like protein 2 isoform X2 [Lemur catta]